MSRWWTATMLLLLGQSAATDLGGEDDAGSGGDAPDAFLAPLLVGPGHFQGNLSGVNDLADSYGFVTSKLQVVRIDFSMGEELSVKIVDPEDNIRGCFAKTPDQTFSFSIVTYPFGTWEVRFDRGYCAGLVSALPRNMAAMPGKDRASYEFGVEVDDYQHFERLEFAEAHNLTFELGLMTGQYGRLELEFAATHTDYGPWATAQALDVRRGGIPAGGDLSFGSFRQGLGFGGPTFWSSGVLPDDALITLPVTAAFPPVGDPPRRLVVEGSPDVVTEVAFGYVHTSGFRASGWLVWNESIQFDMLEGTSIMQKPLREFQADGIGLQTGPWVIAERAATTYDAGAATEILYVDARAPRVDSSLPPVQLAESRFEIVTPNGTRLYLVNESRGWFEDELGTGRWDIVAHDVNGAWGETFVVIGIKFPF